MSKLRTIAYKTVSALAPILSGIGPTEARRSIAMIVCHGVYDEREVSKLPPPTTALPLRSFSSNILALQKTHSFISMSEAIAMLAGKSRWRERCVVLTFDDSLKCLVHLAIPLLVDWDIPATFYISTEAVETRKPYWWHRLAYVMAFAAGRKIELDLEAGRPFVLDPSPASKSTSELKKIMRGSPSSKCDRLLNSLESQIGVSLIESNDEYSFAGLMTWDDVASLPRANMTVGSHTLTHPNLTAISAGDLAMELGASKKLLEEKTGGRCDHFCYPYGGHSDAVCTAAETAGYLSAVTTIEPGWNGPGSDVFRLRRFHLPAEAYKLPYVVYGVNQWVHRRTVETVSN